jgi:hypothetical protein
VSFTRLDLCTRALKGHGFSSSLLQTLPELEALFRIDRGATSQGQA